MKLNEYQGNGHDNMMRDEVFGSYMNPALVDVVAEEVTAKRIKNSARWSFGRADDKPVKAPEFSLKSGFDKQEMLFKMMEMCKPDVSYR